MADKLGFTFYPKDWWSSDSYFNLDAFERYVYLECLFLMYTNGGYLTQDRTQIENRIREPIKPNSWDKITQSFIHTDLGFSLPSVNKRLKKSVSNRLNGQKGGRPPSNQKPKKPNLETQNNPPLEREREYKGEREGEGEKEREIKPIKLDSGENNFSPTPPQKKIESVEYRKISFKKKIEPFLEKYGREMLNDFFGYWTEINENGKKMRFEMQKVFDPGRRLATWYKNEKNNFNGKQTGNTAIQSRQQRVDEVAEFRRANQQSIVERLQKHITGSQ